MEDIKWSKLVRCLSNVYPNRYFLIRENGTEKAIDYKNGIPYTDDGLALKLSSLRKYEKQLIKDKY